jgi:hypothetical protein
VELNHFKWVPCHHGMARSQVADGGDGLQIWRVAANVLNKQSRTADRGWSSSLGVGRGANNPPTVNPLICHKTESTAPDQDGLFGTGKWI